MTILTWSLYVGCETKCLPKKWDLFGAGKWRHTNIKCKFRVKVRRKVIGLPYIWGVLSRSKNEKSLWMHFDAKHRWMKIFDSESANHIGCETEEGEKEKKDARRYAMVCDRLNLNSGFLSLIFGWIIVQMDTMGLARRVELEFLLWKFVRVSDVLQYEWVDFWRMVVGRSVWFCAGLAFSSSLLLFFYRQLCIQVKGSISLFQC